MGPNTTLREISLYLAACAMFAAFDHAVSLRHWLDRGGFEPTNKAEYPTAWEYVQSLKGKV